MRLQRLALGGVKRSRPNEERVGVVPGVVPSSSFKYIPEGLS
jgi:hypothetical protein